MEPLLLIANADGGTAEQSDLESALAVLRAGTDVEVCHTSNPGELDGVLQRAGSRPLVVAGGDGSMHAVVAALHRRNELAGRVIGLLPLGTGNDFARTLDLPAEPAEAAGVVLAGNTRELDLLVDELGEVVVNNVHAGSSARASRTGAAWKERLGRVGLGVLGYPVGAAIAAVRPSFVRLNVEVDGEVVADLDRRVLMVAVGNAASVGGGAEVTPHADPGDGRVDVMVSFATGPLARFGYVWHLRDSRHHHRDDVLYLRGEQVTICGEDFWISADGELSGPERRRTWHLEPSAYTMIVPAGG
ncbi:MAG: diacylglycerol/lipid kinase family protein [Marmoricola sp.]